MNLSITNYSQLSYLIKRHTSVRCENQLMNGDKLVNEDLFGIVIMNTGKKKQVILQVKGAVKHANSKKEIPKSNMQNNSNIYEMF